MERDNSCGGLEIKKIFKLFTKDKNLNLIFNYILAFFACINFFFAIREIYYFIYGFPWAYNEIFIKLNILNNLNIINISPNNFYGFNSISFHYTPWSHFGIQLFNLLLSSLIIYYCNVYLTSNGRQGKRVIKATLVFIFINCIKNLAHLNYYNIQESLVPNSFLILSIPKTKIIFSAFYLAIISYIVFCKSLVFKAQNVILKENEFENHSIFNLREDYLSGLVLASKNKQVLNFAIDCIVIAYLSYVSIAIYYTYYYFTFLLFCKAFLAISILYYVIAEKIFGYTIGKALTGSKVVSTNGKPISTKQVIIRSLTRLVPLEQISAFNNNDASTMWHDEWSNTMVVED